MVLTQGSRWPPPDASEHSLHGVPQELVSAAPPGRTQACSFSEPDSPKDFQTAPHCYSFTTDLGIVVFFFFFSKKHEVYVCVCAHVRVCMIHT